MSVPASWRPTTGEYCVFVSVCMRVRIYMYVYVSTCVHGFGVELRTELHLAIASWLYFIDTLEISKREVGCVDFGDHI
jgi:hypothetical protein